MEEGRDVAGGKEGGSGDVRGGLEGRRLMVPYDRCLGKNSLGEAELTTRVYTAGN